MILARVDAVTQSRDARLRTLAVVAGLIVWALVLRPAAVGGPTSYVLVSGASMQPTLHGGDLVVAHAKTEYRKGDVIVYPIPAGDAGAGTLVIHRIIGGSASTGFITQGDNRSTRDLWRPKHDDVVGAQWVAVPRAGVVFAFVRTPLGIALLAALAAMLYVRKAEARGGQAASSTSTRASG